MRPSRLDRINTDRQDANAASFEFRQPLLEAPQLGVAEQSPMPAIKNQERAVASRKQVMKRNRLAILVRQRELRRFLANARRSRRGRHLPENMKKRIREQAEQSQAQHAQDWAGDFAAINLWIPERANQPRHEQDSGDAEQQKIRPGKIPRNRILRKKRITKQSRSPQKRTPATATNSSAVSSRCCRRHPQYPLVKH